LTLAPGTPIGKYVVRRKIAEGGMAEIYLCSARGPEGFEKEVAIKRVKAFLLSDPGFVKMFITEARVASKLNHANVVQIFDFDKHEDSYYLAMEYVRGQSLWSVRQRARDRMMPVSPLLAAQIGAEVARGLDHAHRLTDRGRPLRIVHRDVTPHNVLISYEGAVKLTDFGIAKAGEGTTAPGILKGKFAYMSPEQARGEPVDARTDVFALGVVLWELLTGGRLFEGDGDVAVLKAVQERAIPPPVRLNPEVPEDLNAAVMKALDRDIDRRFATASEFERALSRFLFQAAASVEARDLVAYMQSLFPEEIAAPQPEVSPVDHSEDDRVLIDSPDESSGANTYVLPGRRGQSPQEAPLGPRSEERPSASSFRRRKAWLVAALLALGLTGTVAGGRWWRKTAPVQLSVPERVTPVAPQPQPVPSSTPVSTPQPAPEPVPPPAEPALPPPTSEVSSRRTTTSDIAPVPRGFIRVKIKPWGAVYLDGRLLGEASPELRKEVSAGSHRLTVTHRETWKRDVNVRVQPGSEAYREWTVPSASQLRGSSDRR
jgi:serine/threonine protein kinase